MWHTSSGDRTLTGAEAALLKAAIADMTDSLRDEADGLVDEDPCGVKLFDELSWQQRLALLARVASALLDPKVRAPEITAVNEATVAALFAHVTRNLAIELDYATEPELPQDFDRFYWRRLLAACQREPNDEFYVEWNSNDADDWNLLIECLQDEILWDNDWSMSELFMDAEPEIGQHNKDYFGIDGDYYADIAPDLRDAEVSAVFSNLQRLAGND